MTRLSFDHDVTSQPAMPPPPPAPRQTGQEQGLAKSAKPGHNGGQGDQR